MLFSKKIKVELVDPSLSQFEPFLKKGTINSSGYDLKAISIKGMYHHNNNKINVTNSGDLMANTMFKKNGYYDLPPGKRILIGTNVKFQFPKNVEAEVRSRSSLPFKKGLILANGVGTIDNDYIGEVKVALINTSGVSVRITQGERIAQILFKKSYNPDIEYVKKIDVETKRGSGGFGSSGKF